MLVVVAGVMARRGVIGSREERDEQAAHGPGEGSEPLAVHDDPVLDQPGLDSVEGADGIHIHHGEPELPFSPSTRSSRSEERRVGKEGRSWGRAWRETKPRKRKTMKRQG